MMNTRTFITWQETKIGKIPSDWSIIPLSEISQLITDGSHFSPKEITEGNHIIATVKDMTYGGFNFDSCKKISDDDFQTLLRNGCSPGNGDILISKDGANCLDLVFVYNQKRQIVLLSSIAIVRLKSEYDPHFYRYSLLSPNIQKLMREGFKSGSAIPRVVLKDFRKVSVPLPPLPEQRAIAEILSSIDDKIELNNQMNRTLEATAQAIFKQWFVDFEFPLGFARGTLDTADSITQRSLSSSAALTDHEAEMSGYKSSGGKMIDSELGPIPEGWRVSQINEFGNIICGKTPPTQDKDNYTDGLIPFIKIPDMHNQVFSIKTETCITKRGALCLNNKQLPPYSLCVSCIATVGLVIITDQESYTNQQINSIILNERFTLYYLYFTMKSLTDKITALASTGSATLNLNTGQFSKISIVRPDEDLLKLFYNHVTDIFEKIKQNDKQSQTLSALRDSLLPKLMSGELRVPEEIVKSFEDAV